MPSLPTNLSRPEDSQDRLEVVMVDMMPIARYAMAGITARTDGLCWGGGTDRPGEAAQCGTGAARRLVLLDSGLDPDTTRLATLRRAQPGWVVVCLLRDRHRTARYVQAAQAAGAHGILPRTASPAEIAFGLRLSQRTGAYLETSLAPLATAPTTTTNSHSHETLSAREHEVLSWVSHGATNAETGPYPTLVDS